MTARPRAEPPPRASCCRVGVVAGFTWRCGSASTITNTTRAMGVERRVPRVADPVGDLSERLVDALNAAYGVHAGHRAAHAKGVLCAATFTATPAAGALTKAAHFQGQPMRAHVRFSNGAGDPTIADGTRDARGMAVKVYLADATTTDVVTLTLPTFFVRTPEELIEIHLVPRPDPETAAPAMA